MLAEDVTLPDRYTLSVTRLWLGTVLLAGGALFAQEPPQQDPSQQIQEPPEEDVNVETVKEYAFNPLQATKEIKVGAYYFKKGSYKAAVRRFEEALKWDPNSAEAYQRLGDARIKLNDSDGARAAYTKYLELDPDSKDAKSVRSKLEKLETKSKNDAPGEPAVPRRSS